MSENEPTLNIYEVVPELANGFIGQRGLLAVIIGGSFASHSFGPGSDIDADLLFQKLNSGHATTIAHTMTNQFKERGLILDVRTCVDLMGNAIFLHQKQGLLRHPVEGTVNISSLYNATNIIVPSSFDIAQLK